MRKTIKVIMTCFILGVCTVQAQNMDEEMNSTTTTNSPSKDDIQLIPLIGISSFTIFGKDVNGVEPLNTSRVGVLLDRYLSEKLSFRTGLIFDKMGATDGSTNLELTYINIPINLNVHFSKSKKWNWNFGLSAGILYKANSAGYNYKELINPFQLAFSTGVGRKIDLTDKIKLLIDYRLLIGLSEINKDASNGGVYNIGSSISIGGVFIL